MLWACLAWVAAAAPPDAPEPGYVVSLNSEARAVPSASLALPAGALDVSPSGQLVIRWDNLSIQALYEPELVLLSAEGGSVPYGFSQHGLIRLLQSWESGSNAAIGENIRYGTFDLGGLIALPTAAEPTVTPVAKVGILRYLYSNAEASMALVLAPRLKLALAGGDLISGGADAPSRAFLPLGVGPEASATATVRATPRAEMDTRGTWSEVAFTPGPEVQLATAAEEMRVRALPFLEVGATAGVGQATANPTTPIGRLAVRYRPIALHRLEASVEGGHGLFLDRLVAAIYPRWDAMATVSWAFTEGVGIEGRLGGAHARDAGTYGRESLILVDAAATYRASRSWKIKVGTRGIWEEATLPVPGAFAYWSGFIGAEFTTHGELEAAAVR